MPSIAMDYSAQILTEFSTRDNNPQETPTGKCRKSEIVHNWKQICDSIVGVTVRHELPANFAEGARCP